MHTDRKIGFAMGILLTGIVAALFFRNEPLLPTEVPVVRREKELNERLRERDVAVYLNESKTSDSKTEESSDQPWTLRDVLRSMDEKNKSLPSPVAASEKPSNSAVDGRPDRSLDGFRRPRQSPSQAVRSDLPVPTSLDETPASTPVTLPPLLPETLPEMPPGDHPGTEDDIPAVQEFPVPEEFEEYVVRYGDTLSGIAEQFLGSQAKYQEIFDANRDRIASPDRLDVGKPIRIPR